VAGILLSCHKGSSGGSYHLTATIDGQTQSFDASLRATHVGSLATAIQGRASANDTFPNLQLALIALDSPAIGTYGNSNNPQIQVNGILELNDTARYNGAGLAQSTNANPTVITITAWDANTVQGSFSGNFYLNNTANSPKKVITGDFIVPWKK